MNTILAAEGFDVEDIDLLKVTIIYYKIFDKLFGILF
jgi:hypothetical protein